MSKTHDWSDDVEIPEEFSGGDLNYLESYVQLDVDKTSLDIGADATNLITQLCNVYLKNDLITNEDYVKAIAAIEITQLSSAMLAVRSVEHALKTLMRQLDAGGYTNSEVFDQINTLSKTSLDLTLKTSQYLRSLPEYLKFTATEMKDLGLMKSVQILQDSSKIGENGENVVASSYDIAGPMMGTKALMLQIRDEETDLNEVIKNSKIKQREIEAANLKLDDEKTFAENKDFEEV